MKLPIVCTLTADELQERRKTILALVRNAAVDRTPIPTGYRYGFAANSAIRGELDKMVELEQKCCQFLKFTVFGDEKTLYLEVTGQPEAITIIEDLFG